MTNRDIFAIIWGMSNGNTVSTPEGLSLPPRIEVDPRIYTDELTGLKNRAWLADHLPQIIQEGSGRIGLLMLDLDDFKQLNDTQGHEAGDIYLKRAGQVLDEKTRHDQEGRNGDSIRLSGDEFVVVLHDIDNEEGLRVVLERVQLALDKNGVGASIGAIVHRGERATEFLKRADDALYAAKYERKVATKTPEQWEAVEQIGDLVLKHEIDPRNLPILLEELEKRKQDS